ncbi:PEP motif putative anchor domain protein [Nitrosomonas sp. Is79A3]|uniref:PEP-CTERM sorting domain-containing protein n=1 Tax=Nitrosomonas sp. (strain Is79A3) TaxID=261292 RepID=UPI000215CA06
MKQVIKNKKIKIFISISCLTLLAMASSAQAITFSPFVTSTDLNTTLGNTATIGFTYAGDKFVGSVYYGANNNQLYSTDLTGGSIAKFGSPVPSFSGEVYVSSSLGIGGYGPRDIYAGAQFEGSVYRFANDGSSQNLFASGLVGGVRSIAFDPYGLYNNNMIVATTSGNIYEVSNTGVPTLLASVGEDAEGISFAPQTFGSYAAGTLFVASEGSGSLRAITPDGTVTTAISGLYGAEMVSFVPLDLGDSGNPLEGFYAAAYPSDIQFAAASEFTAYKGDAIITGETGHQVWQVHPDGSSFTANLLGYFPGQPEDGIFVTADILNPVPEPQTYAMLLTGLGLLGFMARRRKHSAV